MTDNYFIKPLSIEDLDQVARIHVQAFPESTLSHFGKTLVKRYYSLNMSEPNECYAIGVFSEGGLVGFCFAGVFRDVKYSFLRQNWFLLLTKLLTKPWLLFDKKIKRRSLNILNYVKKERNITKRSGGVATKKKRRFGILSIAIDPAYRSKGLGKMLMDQCEHYAMIKNFDVMDLTVDVNNLPTIHFYDRLGWSKVLSSDGSWLGRMEKHLV